MKQRITMADVTELTQYQRDRLNELWTPQKNDVAVGFLCMDAENNKYDVFEFVIGHINLRETRAGYHMTMINLEALRDLRAQENSANEEEEATEEVDLEEYNEDDFIFEYERPDIYSKGDCIPLLSIGQIIEILNKCGYGNGNFYTSLNKGKNECGIGKDIEQFIDYGMDFIEEELCDALWAALKDVL